MSLQTKRVLAIILVLVCSAGARVWYHATPGQNLRQPLERLSDQLGSWHKVQEHVISASDQAVLKADDNLLRSYRNPQGREATIFIAFYRVQRAGEAMHSPRNCLPGWGWSVASNDRVQMETNAEGQPVLINRFLVEKDDEHALVLYWYEAHHRVVASEYTGKVLLVWDALRTNRREGSLLRVTMPLAKGQDVESATQAGLELARAIHNQMTDFLP